MHPVNAAFSVVWASATAMGMDCALATLDTSRASLLLSESGITPPGKSTALPRGNRDMVRGK